jgi:hypothetical protein
MWKQQRSFGQPLYIASSGIQQRTGASAQDKQQHSFQQAARQLQLRRLDAPEQPQHQQIILRVRDTVAARARVKGGHTGFESAAASRGPKLLRSE